MDARVVFSKQDSDLTIDAAPYELLAVGVTGQTWRRNVIEGRYQPGRALVGAVQGTPTLTVTARISGDSWAAVTAARRGLEAAVWQLDYTATVTLADQVDVYMCEPADVFVIDTTVDRWKAMDGFQDITLSIPIRP